MPHTTPYPSHVRDGAIRRVNVGESKSSVARELNISLETIGRWTPEVISRRPIDLALREKVIERVSEGRVKTQGCQRVRDRKNHGHVVDSGHRSQHQASR